MRKNYLLRRDESVRFVVEVFYCKAQFCVISLLAMSIETLKCVVLRLLD